jgi:hypothetical protein
MVNRLTYDNLNSLAIWNEMKTISLEEMRSVKLMNRIDTKYVVTNDEFLELLAMVSSQGYKVQAIDGLRAVRYDTLYYDTEERAMYIAHHNQMLNRQKIRTRHYVDSNQTFLEVKNKSNRGRTDKRRTSIDLSYFSDIHRNPQAVEYLSERSRYDIATLTPALATRFVRITIVNPTLSERVTIDLDLEYEDMRSGRRATIEGMAIIEIKQDGNLHSHTKDRLRDMRITPLKVSKYCLGSALTVADIKRNRMLLKLRDIEKRIGYNRVRVSDVIDNK